SDLLVINKTDLAPYVGADLGVMERDSQKMRGDGPTVFTQVRNGDNVDLVVAEILKAFKEMGAEEEYYARCA
ncbi:hypothetical protein HDU80_002835, partial [Chytriomyces hyalinus]